MYTVTVYIVCATAVVTVASIIFVIAAAAVTISHGVKLASTALRTFWRNRILATFSQEQLLPGSAPRGMR